MSVQPFTPTGRADTPPAGPSGAGVSGEPITQVEIEPVSPSLLAKALAPDRVQELLSVAERARALLEGRIVWNVNSTAHGGGVAEMLQTLVAYGRGAGVDTRWLVLQGDPEFFSITKRIHNKLHGHAGDGGPLGAAEHTAYDRTLVHNLALIRELVRPQDIVLLHDPQTAGLVRGLKDTGATVVWRCHVGADVSNDHTVQAWNFLRDYVVPADAFVFSRFGYAPEWASGKRLWVIPPSIDPFAAKNLDLPAPEVDAILRRAGLLAGDDTSAELPFTRRDGSRGAIHRYRDLMGDDVPPSESDRLVIQVSRWDALKDMTGVLTGFAAQPLPDDVHLMLVGPDISAVTDDPEGATVLEQCRVLWRGLPPAQRSRVHLVCLPMDDVDENALIVNALQRRGTVLVQKSLVEGFGLTVTEALWKSRPVLASAVGGIRDQITDGVSGVLIAYPADLAEFGTALKDLLADPVRAARLGAAAHERVVEEYLGDRHLAQYVELFGTLIDRKAVGAPGDTTL